MRKLAKLTVHSALVAGAVANIVLAGGPIDTKVAYKPTQNEVERRAAVVPSRGYTYMVSESNRRNAEALAEAQRLEQAKVAEAARLAEAAILAEAKRKEEAEKQSDGRYSLRVQATAYTAFEPGQTSGTGLAYDGRPAIGYHTLAVDPRVIPLGSKVYVPGLGWFLAHDTGGAIKGNIVDVCLDTHSEAIQWGRRTVEVIVVPPKTKYKMAW
jgi:3D (Asp-Asp-Asp) domain-containing protein